MNFSFKFWITIYEQMANIVYNGYGCMIFPSSILYAIIIKYYVKIRKEYS